MANEINYLKAAGILVVALTAVILVGLAVTEGFSKQLRTETTSAGQLTFADVNVSQRQDTFPYIQSVPNCTNESSKTEVLLTGTNYTIKEGNGDGGYMILGDPSAAYANETVNCTLTYLADSTGSGVGDNFITGLGIFGSFIAVVILALMGKVIVGIFRRKN